MEKKPHILCVDDDDKIISAKHIPDLGDNLFILTKKGMMIRIVTGQTKDTKTKKSKGTRIMELRNKSRDGYEDEIIFTARLPAELLEQDQFDAMDTDGDGVGDNIDAYPQDPAKSVLETKDESSTNIVNIAIIAGVILTLVVVFVLFATRKKQPEGDLPVMGMDASQAMFRIW